MTVKGCPRYRCLGMQAILAHVVYSHSSITIARATDQYSSSCTAPMRCAIVLPFLGSCSDCMSLQDAKEGVHDTL